MTSRDTIVLRFPARNTRNRVSFRTLKRLAAVFHLSLDDTVHRVLAEFARKILTKKRRHAPRIRKKAARKRL